MKSGILQGERKFHHPPRVVSFGEILFDGRDQHFPDAAALGIHHQYVHTLSSVN